MSPERNVLKLPSRSHAIDKVFFGTVLVLLVLGLLVFTSASFGLLSRSGASFGSVAFNQLVLGLGGGAIAGFLMYKIPYTFFRRYAFYFFILSILITLLVFIPGVGLDLGGAKRWISIAGVSFQPAEFLKLGFILFFASFLSSIKKDIETWRYGVAPMAGTLAIMGIILIAQPDNGTLLIIIATAISMFIAAGGKWKHLGAIVLGALVTLMLVASFKPYVMNRLVTFINPSSDPLGASYQIRQSLVSIGSGGFFGRGFGQSIQKFNHLPEPVGDSIFAVYSEEFGFVGAITLIGIFLFLSFRGLKIARAAPDNFASLATVGLITMIVSQSFLNIGAMLGVFPLTGVPLLFVSQGGSALLFTLAEMGLILQFSKYTR